MKKTKTLNDFTKNVAISLLLVAAMLFGAATIPATFAALAPVDDPYASTAATNATSSDYSLAARDVIADLNHDSTWGAWNQAKEYVLNDIDDAKKIINIIKDNATFDGMHATTYIPEEYDLLIETPTQSVYITFLLDEVTVNTRGAGLVYKLPVEATWDIMDIYKRSQGVDVDSKCPLVNSEAYDLTICDSEWNYVDVSTESLQQIVKLINDGYSYFCESDFYYPKQFDFVIFDIVLGNDVYIMADTNELLVIDYHNTAYIYTVESSVMDEIMRLYKDEPTIELTDAIVGNIVWLAETKGFTVGAISYEDICNVYYHEEDCYQSAMEIVVTMAASYMSDEMTMFYLGQAMQAPNWEGMRENLIYAIERYAVSSMKYSKDSANNSFASQLVADSFSENWYDLDTMDIVHYALWMSVVAGGCY